MPHRHLAAAGAILTLCMPVTSSAFGLDLACQGYLLLPDSDSKLVEQLGCPAACAGMAIGFAVAAPAAAVMAPLPLADGDTATERFHRVAGLAGFATAQASAAAVLAPAFVAKWLLYDPVRRALRGPRRPRALPAFLHGV